MSTPARRPRTSLGFFFSSLVLVALLAGCSESEVADTPCEADEDCPSGAVCDGDFCAEDGDTSDEKCQEGRTDCDGQCVDLDTSGDHCGSCGLQCDSNEVCAGGSCICDSDSVECGNQCVDPSSDDDHCGDCGNQCPDQKTCHRGNCVDDCPDGQVLCDGECVNLEDNDDHCGQCGFACSTHVSGGGSVCDEGQCVDICVNFEDHTLCEEAGLCADLQSDDHHCGQCGNECGTGETCDNGDCVCADGYEDCGDGCIDVTASADHCGGCGEPCGENQVCNGGSCDDACPTGQATCDGGCYDLQTSDAHCGECDNDCTTDIDGAFAECDGSGSCTVQCSHDGYSKCKSLGYCADLDNDPENCGDCGNECTTDIDGAVAACDGSGTCTESCVLSTHTKCEAQGVCANLQEDGDYCGSCDNSCGTGESCVDGTCTDGGGGDPDPDDCNPDGDPFGGGEGTAVSPYRICSAAQLNRINNSTDQLGRQYDLYADIDLGNVTDFPAIGQGTYDYDNDEWSGAFSGVFDGRGHEIQNLTMDGDDDVALFGALDRDGGRIRDLDLVGVDITGQENVGGLVARNDGEVVNCSVSGTVQGTSNVGGLVGFNFWKSTVDASDSSGQVSSSGPDVGGLAGRNYGRITDSESSAAVEGPKNVGGLVGLTGESYDQGGIARSRATGPVSESGDPDESFGGLVGTTTSFGNGAITRSVATGDVDAPNASRVGGFLGANFIEDEIRDSYATGDVTGSYHVGGFVGYLTDDNNAVYDSYAWGSNNGAGFVGENGGNTAFYNCYYRGADGDDDLATGLTDDQFADPATFEDDWDFTDTWTMSDSAGRPILLWEQN